MITKCRIRKILIEGRDVDCEDYFHHCVTHHPKTFYFFCERLSRERINGALSSTTLNDYVIAQLRRRRVAVNSQFNPQGWFGKAWTDWSDPSKDERYFRNEYGEVLLRIETKPYSYKIRPECVRHVKEIFREFVSGVDPATRSSAPGSSSSQALVKYRSGVRQDVFTLRLKHYMLKCRTILQRIFAQSK
jgi:hypothetical protein